MPPTAEIIYPNFKLNHPERKVFEVNDPNNRPAPVWFYRDRKRLFGPFETKADADQHLCQNASIKPWKDAIENWWWTDLFGVHHGPFLNSDHADTSIFEWLSSDAPIDL